MNNIKYWREYHGISQRELARQANVSYTEMTNIENEHRTPNVYIAMDIAKVLKVPVEKLFSGDGK